MAETIEVSEADLTDIGIAVCTCGDFLCEHGDDSKCLICPCQQFKQDIESDEFYLRTEK